MKNIKSISLGLLTATILFTGCTNQPQIMGSNSTKTAPVTMGIDRQDFEKAASDMVESLLNSGALNKKAGGRYVVMISDIVNDTTQRIDTRMLTKKIRVAMLRSGKAVITSAVGTERDDTTINATRSARNNSEFNQQTAIKDGQLINAELGLAGRIMQRAAKTADNDQMVEYYFQLTLTNAANGLAYWEDEVIIGKLGSNDTVTW
ncbi:penicillin-binding protein activator LpoB [Aliarcobacter cryaerophilus]|jgi:penicillin-binding protein activator|uniref:penicillin-binding protein activator LpoB n=1 Tax=Aliarcobacter cryaerophilus TaxID=28198 RepID=UPI003DA6C227